MQLLLDYWLSQLNWDSKQGRDLAMSAHNQKKSIRPILFLYYEESLVLSNLNSNLLRCHFAHPKEYSQISWWTSKFSIFWRLATIPFKTFDMEAHIRDKLLNFVTLIWKLENWLSRFCVMQGFQPYRTPPLIKIIKPRHHLLIMKLHH